MEDSGLGSFLLLFLFCLGLGEWCGDFKQILQLRSWRKSELPCHPPALKTVTSMFSKTEILASPWKLQVTTCAVHHYLCDISENPLSFPAKICAFHPIGSGSPLRVRHTVPLTSYSVEAAVMSSCSQTFLFPYQAPQFLLLFLRWLVLKLHLSWPLMHPGHQVLLKLCDIITDCIIQHDEILSHGT